MNSIDLKEIVEAEVNAVGPWLAADPAKRQQRMKDFAAELKTSFNRTNRGIPVKLADELLEKSDAIITDESGKTLNFDHSANLNLIRQLVADAVRSYVDRREAFKNGHTDNGALEKETGVLEGVVSKRGPGYIYVVADGRSFFVELNGVKCGANLTEKVKIRPTGRKDGPKMDAELVEDAPSSRRKTAAAQ